VLVTVGDHIRRRRLDLGLLQREVAERLGADAATITNWELNRTQPALRFLPAIVGFLGYPP
jgi:transcriptional regulator with XRE-family HTH domain